MTETARSPSDPAPPLTVHLQVFGISHQTAPLEVREALDLTEAKRATLSERLSEALPDAEYLILNTCNRFEIYLAAEPDPGAGAAIRETFESIYGELHEPRVEQLPEHTYWKVDAGAARHLFRVAAGLDSQLVGENEILGQLKRAYQQSKDSDLAGARLHRLLQKAFQTAKQARTATAIGEGQVSIGSIAVDLAERIFGNLKRARALLIGTGEVGRATLKALQSRGARQLTVTSRSTERGTALATELDAAALPWANFSNHLEDFDIVLAATQAERPVIDADAIREAIRRRPARPLFLIDLGMPANIERISEPGLTNVFRYALADLAEIANQNLSRRQDAIAECEALVQERAFRFWGDWVQRERRRSWKAKA
jgi:glutamyl-tRNA reductase